MSMGSPDLETKRETRRSAREREMCLSCTRPECHGECEEIRAVTVKSREYSYGGLTLTVPQWAARWHVTANPVYTSIKLHGGNFEEVAKKYEKGI